MMQTVTYKGEELVRSYCPTEGARYAAFLRRSAIEARYFVYRNDGEIICCSPYKRGAVRVVDELNALAGIRYQTAAETAAKVKPKRVVKSKKKPKTL